MSYKFSMVLFLLIVLVMSSGYADDNIVVNPGFESGREGWYDRTCAIKVISSELHSGRSAGKAIERGANWQGIKQSLFGKMVDGSTYKVSGWVKLDNAASDEMAISFEQQDDAGTRYIGVARELASDTAWLQLFGEFTLNVTGTLSVLDVYFEGPVPGVNFYVDDVVVYGPVADAPPVIPAKPKGTVKINANVRHQKIEGFGASGAYYTMNLTDHAERNEICKLLFRDLGLDIFRIRNNYKMEPNSLKETVEIVKCAEAVSDHDLKIMLTSWSPPAYLKSNNNTVGGTLKRKKGEYMYKEFADWWLQSLKAYEKAGVQVDYINVQNELDYEAPWNSCQFAPSDTHSADLPAYDIAFETVWQKLHSKMGADMPKMLAPESSGLGNGQEYLLNMDDLSHVYGYAHHLYDCSGCGIAPDRFIPRMTSLREFIDEHGNLPIFQTEFEEDPGTWADAINTALVIHNAMTVLEAAAYLYWDLFWAPGTGLLSMDDQYTYTIKPTYYTFKQYAAFIYHGWQRVAATTENTGLRISVYISPDNQQLTAVLINTTTATDIKVDLQLDNFSVVKGDIYRSSVTESCVRVGGFNGQNPLRVPANSVVTLSLTAGTE